MPTTPLTTTPTTTGPPIPCEKKEGMSDDVCCINAGDVAISVKKVNEDVWTPFPTPTSLAAPIAVEPETEQIRVDIEVDELDRLASASVKSSDNIKHYTIKLVGKDGNETVLGPVSICK